VKINENFASRLCWIRILSSVLLRSRRSRSEIRKRERERERERERDLRPKYTQSRSIVCLSAWRAPSLHHLIREAALFILLHEIKLVCIVKRTILSNHVEIFCALFYFQLMLLSDITEELLRELFQNIC